MNRRLPVVLAVVTVAATGAVPATAAKPKPKPITGSYTVKLVPDPSPNADVTSTCGVVPGSWDDHPFTAPAKGTFAVDLVAKDSFPNQVPVVDDWDLYVMEGGSPRSSSTGETGTEHTVDKIKGRTNLVIRVCNLTGTTDAKVSYRFTYA